MHALANHPVLAAWAAMGLATWAVGRGPAWVDAMGQAFRRKPAHPVYRREAVEGVAVLPLALILGPIPCVLSVLARA